MVEGISSFRGPVTSNDWCEKNYVYSSYVAEFFNTMSNITSILLAFVDLINALRQRFEKRFSILHISNIILAVGSLLYHATLQHMQQLGDETPMVWEMLFAFLHPVLLALLKYNADLFVPKVESATPAAPTLGPDQVVRRVNHGLSQLIA